MGFNIVDLISSQLSGGGTLNKLAGSLGLEPDQAQKAVGAAVPALLAGLSGVASTPEGARRLSDTVARQDSGILDNFGSMLSGQATSLSQGGSSMLGSLLGGNTLNGVVGAISKFTGVGQGGIGSLLGMIAPLVMGMLGRQQKTLGLDASGLASMLAGQKQNILGAMPAGLGNMLGGIPGLGAVTDGLRGAGDVARDAYQGAADTVRDAYGAAGRATRETAYQAKNAGSSAMRWVLPLAAAVLLGLVLWQFIPRGTVTPAAPLAASTAAINAEATRISTTVKDSVDSLTTTLAGVKDAATAEAALPQLRDVSTKLGGLKSMWDALPASARSTLSSTLGTSTSSLRTLFDKVNAIPGVGDKLKPVLDDILARLTALR